MDGGMETIPFSADFLRILLPLLSWETSSTEAFIRPKKLQESSKDMVSSLMMMSNGLPLNILFLQGKMIRQKTFIFHQFFSIFAAPKSVTHCLVQ
jgi:hypothetical protein